LELLKPIDNYSDTVTHKTKNPMKLHKFYHSVPFKCPFCFTFKEIPSDFIDHLTTSHYPDVKLLYEKKCSKLIIEQSVLRNKGLLNANNGENNEDDEDDDDDENDDEDTMKIDEKANDENELEDNLDETKSNLSNTHDELSENKNKLDENNENLDQQINETSPTTPPQTPSQIQHSASPSSLSASSSPNANQNTNNQEKSYENESSSLVKSSYASINSSLLPPRKQQRLLKSPLNGDQIDSTHNNNNYMNNKLQLEEKCCKFQLLNMSMSHMNCNLKNNSAFLDDHGYAHYPDGHSCARRLHWTGCGKLWRSRPEPRSTSS
jgi:hypothetical protein